MYKYGDISYFYIENTVKIQKYGIHLYFYGRLAYSQRKITEISNSVGQTFCHLKTAIFGQNLQ